MLVIVVSAMVVVVVVVVVVVMVMVVMVTETIMVHVFRYCGVEVLGGSGLRGCFLMAQRELPVSTGSCVGLRLRIDV